MSVSVWLNDGTSFSCGHRKTRFGGREKINSVFPPNMGNRPALYVIMNYEHSANWYPRSVSTVQVFDSQKQYFRAHNSNKQPWKQKKRSTTGGIRNEGSLWTWHNVLSSHLLVTQLPQAPGGQRCATLPWRWGWSLAVSKHWPLLSFWDCPPFWSGV